jgi:hypothetical protein
VRGLGRRSVGFGGQMARSRRAAVRGGAIFPGTIARIVIRTSRRRRDTP